MSNKARQNIAMICGSTGVSLNEEQRLFAEDFTRPMYSISNAGTGKSTTTCIGIINAQTHHQIPGKSINIMSYTKAATAEIRAKYELFCKKCGTAPTANFKTFHAICYSIVLRVYPNMNILYEDFTRDCDDFKDLAEDVGFPKDRLDDIKFVRSLYNCILSMDNKLIYDTVAVSNTCSFRKLEVDINKFQDMRWRWFAEQLKRRRVLRGYLPTFALWILLKNPNIVAEYRKNFRIMVVDEFQDFGILGLKILSLVAHNLIVIGDKRQSIYKFAGAYPKIFDEYKKMYPTARRLDLTQSYRCCNEIAEYSNEIIRAYDIDSKPFIGVGEGGKVTECFSRDLPIESIVSRISKDIEVNGFGRAAEYMFLFRNNLSAAGIIEELFQAGIKVWCEKFMKVQQLELFKDLCVIVDATIHPGDFTYLNRLMPLIPEFKDFNEDNNPLFMAMRKSRKNILKVPYTFREESTKTLLHAMCGAYGYIQNGANADSIFNFILPAYVECCLGGEKKWFKYYENEPEYYFNLVKSITTKKDYASLIAQEDNKAIKIAENCKLRLGVRVYTAHSGKGLEAEVVYILDADDNVFPKSKVMTEYQKFGCDLEAAEELVNECNLLYVAITRAKKEVVITYNTELTCLIRFPHTNEYSHLYDRYREDRVDYDDISAFLELYRTEDVKAVSFDETVDVEYQEEVLSGEVL